MPIQAPCMTLIIMKLSTWVMYNKVPETKPQAFINRIKFLLENMWISFFPINAPNKAPIGMHPVNIPRAV